MKPSGLKIRNWHDFQHFKDRTPPWIKLHKTILDQRDINAISDCSFRVLIGLWLLASEDHAMQGNLPPVDDIAFRLRMSNAAINKALQELKPFLIQDDINAISPRYQDDDPETEAKTETKAEVETDLMSFDSFWKAYPRKVGKVKAHQAWKRAKDKPPITDLIAEVELQSRSVEWQKDGGQFIPHPATWLNRGGWLDEVTVKE